MVAELHLAPDAPKGITFKLVEEMKFGYFKIIRTNLQHPISSSPAPLQQFSTSPLSSLVYPKRTVEGRRQNLRG
jgi:hypothetical protein